MRSALVIALCACTGSEPARVPDVAVHAAAPRVMLDVPVLASATGTVEPVAGATIITLAGTAGEVAAQRTAIPQRGPALVAIGRNVAYHAVLPSLEELRAAGVSDIGILVTVANQRRMFLIERWRPTESDDGTRSVAVISAGTVIKFGGEPIALEALPTKLRGTAPDRVVVLPEPDITMQRLAEVIGASGGHVLLGSASLPSVTPSP